MSEQELGGGGVDVGSHSPELGCNSKNGLQVLQSFQRGAYVSLGEGRFKVLHIRGP